MTQAIIIQRPSGQAVQLMLLAHAYGSDAQSMVAVGQLLAAQFPSAFIVSLSAAHACELGQGRQWFSLQGLENDVYGQMLEERVDEAMVEFLADIQVWQKTANLSLEATALIGFAQGGMMALESTRKPATLAGRVVAIASRFAVLPDQANGATTLHLVHGKTDTVVPYANMLQAAERLIELGSDITADVVPFVGHEVNAELVNLIIERLTTYIPRRRWDEALSTRSP